MYRTSRIVYLCLAAAVYAVVSTGQAAEVADRESRRVDTRAMGAVYVNQSTIESQTDGSLIVVTNHTIFVTIDETNRVIMTEAMGIEITELREDVEWLRKKAGALSIVFTRRNDLQIWVRLPSGEQDGGYPAVATSCMVRGKGQFVSCRASIREGQKGELLLVMWPTAESNRDTYKDIISSFGMAPGPVDVRPKTLEKERRITYRVGSNDTLTKIATMFAVSEADILAANPGIDERSLAEGTKLSIPAHE